MPTDEDIKKWSSRENWELKYTMPIGVNYTDINDWIEKKKNPETVLLDKVDEEISVKDSDIKNLDLEVEDYKLKLHEGFIFVNSDTGKIRITTNWKNVSEYYNGPIRFTSVGKNINNDIAKEAYIEISDEDCVGERGVRISEGFIPFIETAFPEDLHKELKKNSLEKIFSTIKNLHTPVYEYSNLTEFQSNIPKETILQEQ